MGERTRCCVIGCRRTTAKPHAEWICAKHWKTVPRQTKADYAAEKRQVRRILARKPVYAEWWKMPPGSSGRLAALGMWRRLDAVWARCKEAATEAAVGLR